MKIDLRLRLVNPDVKVWRIFPGSGYGFRESFVRDSVAFLDFPLLPYEALQGKMAVAAVALSQEAKGQILRDGATHRPNLAIKDFLRARSSKSRIALARTVSNLLFEAKAGDLIVMPSPLNIKKIFVGEFNSNRITSGFHKKYGENKIPARSVNWINEFPESQVSERLSSILRNQLPFTLIDKSIWLEIFSLCYSNFQFNNFFSTTIFNGEDVTNDDSAYISILSKMAGAIAEYDDNNDDNLFEKGLLDILINVRSSEYTCSHACDIHSRGFNRFTGSSISAVAVIALMAMFSIAKNAISQEDKRNIIREIEVTNSSPVKDPHCTPRISRATKKLLEFIDLDSLEKLCIMHRESERRAQLRSGAIAIQDER